MKKLKIISSFCKQSIGQVETACAPLFYGSRIPSFHDLILLCWMPDPYGLSAAVRHVSNNNGVFDCLWDGWR